MVIMVPPAGNSRGSAPSRSNDLLLPTDQRFECLRRSETTLRSGHTCSDTYSKEFSMLIKYFGQLCPALRGQGSHRTQCRSNHAPVGVRLASATTCSSTNTTPVGVGHSRACPVPSRARRDCCCCVGVRAQFAEPSGQLPDPLPPGRTRPTPPYAPTSFSSPLEPQ